MVEATHLVVKASDGARGERAERPHRSTGGLGKTRQSTAVRPLRGKGVARDRGTAYPTHRTPRCLTPTIIRPPLPSNDDDRYHGVTVGRGVEHMCNTSSAVSDCSGSAL